MEVHTYNNVEPMNDLMMYMLVAAFDNMLVYMNNNNSDVDDDQMEDEFLHRHLLDHDEMMMIFHRNSIVVEYVSYEDLNLIYLSLLVTDIDYESLLLLLME